MFPLPHAVSSVQLRFKLTNSNKTPKATTKKLQQNRTGGRRINNAVAFWNNSNNKERRERLQWWQQMLAICLASTGKSLSHCLRTLVKRKAHNTSKREGENGRKRNSSPQCDHCSHCIAAADLNFSATSRAATTDISSTFSCEALGTEGHNVE